MDCHNIFAMGKVTAPQDAHKQFSAAGFPWFKHFRIQWYIGKNFGNIIGFNKMQFTATHEQHKNTYGSAPSTMLLCDHIGHDARQALLI